MRSFKNDYSELAHPRILSAMADAAANQIAGYGLDAHCAAAAGHIRKRLGRFADAVDIHFLCGGTQANLTALSAFLRPHEAVIAADTAHICVHETGAIEATGHKIVAAPTGNNKLRPEDALAILNTHCDEHMVKPRMVKVSQPTEMGLVYSLAELEALSRLCRERNLLLYVDGARLGCALTAEGNDVSLEDLCRLTDAFYIGGTKNGALLGEAMILVNDSLKPDFRYLIKQRGGLLAKGAALGIQFEELFRDNLYFDLARHANSRARRLESAMREAGHGFLTPSPTNQIFPILPNGLIRHLEKSWAFYVWSKVDGGRSAIRLVTSWATPDDMVAEFIHEMRSAAC